MFTIEQLKSLIGVEIVRNGKSYTITDLNEKELHLLSFDTLITSIFPTDAINHSLKTCVEYRVYISDETDETVSVSEFLANDGS